MQLIVERTEKLNGEIMVPPSKSHTIRAVIIASLAEGTSELENPLLSEDTKAAMNACKALGAGFERKGNILTVKGFGRKPVTPYRPLEMLNSGTSTNLVLGILAALGIEAEITGDASLRSRPVTALTDALTALGCSVEFLDRHGYPPLRLCGRISNSNVRLNGAKSSQYVSSLLFACPLLDHDTEVTVDDPSEVPYIEMTIKWLEEQNIKIERDGFNYFKIYGNQIYQPFRKTIASDWSSAAFPLCAAALTDSNVLVKGLDLNDTQGDKAVLDYLESMGADIKIERNGIRIKGRKLAGQELDINSTPDALPILAVVGCCSNGVTKLYNVAQARVKETDRIKVIAEELKKMKANIKELPDGLLIKKSFLDGARVNGHNDHRIVMALSVAAMKAKGRSEIDTAEAVSVTYPSYVESMQKIGARFSLLS